jgi:hypothetical protein
LLLRLRGVAQRAVSEHLERGALRPQRLTRDRSQLGQRARRIAGVERALRALQRF